MTVIPKTLQTFCFPWEARNLLLAVSLLFPGLSAADDLDVTCDGQPYYCLSLIDNKQYYLTVGSPSWWELETKRLRALYDLQKTTELYGALRPWIDNPDVPVKYQPVVAMMYGKWLRIKGRRTEGTVMLEKALEGFRTLKRQDESVQLSLNILNVLVMLHRLEEAERYAEQLIKNGHDSPVFYREVYAELANIARQSDAHQDHVKYRRASLRWAEKIPDEQQKAIAYNNYGVALRNTAQYEEAERAFLSSAELAKAAGDIVLANTLMLRLAEVAFLMRDLIAAHSYLDSIDTTLSTQTQVDKIRKLSSDVAAAKDARGQ